MTKTHRVLAAIALATGATALAAPAASADVAPANMISASNQLDELTSMAVPAEHKSGMPSVSGQLNGIPQGLDRLNELHQLTDLAAPVTGLAG
ncbi:hypothetical protein [Streptomyces sp. NBC_00829]|uniref:hypothetical protein n=1 Tax=Streptomyces sp. NBC_00829 TaxID=2903679 RepID=UPI0038638364|nr:hypothetical protein OG293_32545 [Streptomyces sp. NBC_00829]